MSIESQIQQRVSKEIVHRDIDIVARPIDELHWPKGLGAMATPFGFIIVNNTFWKLDSDACVFVVKHEVGHLTNRRWEENSSTFFKILKCAIPITGASLVYRSCSSMPFIAVGVVATSIFSYCFSRFGEGVLSRRKEYWADSYAIKSSTNSELKGGMRFFEALTQASCLINGDENQSWDRTHPLNISRFNRVKKELESRGEDTALTSNDDLQKIQDMMCWEIYDSSCKVPEDKKPLIEDFKLRCLSDNNA
jgi:predicted Zn-dependent protease